MISGVATLPAVIDSGVLRFKSEAEQIRKRKKQR